MKQYGFNTHANVYLQQHMGDRFRPSQAIAILGCSKAIFYRDKSEGLITPKLNATNRPYYLGSQLLRYLAQKQ